MSLVTCNVCPGSSCDLCGGSGEYWYTPQRANQIELDLIEMTKRAIAAETEAYDLRSGMEEIIGDEDSLDYEADDVYEQIMKLLNKVPKARS